MHGKKMNVSVSILYGSLLVSKSAKHVCSCKVKYFFFLTLYLGNFLLVNHHATDMNNSQSGPLAISSAGASAAPSPR